VNCISECFLYVLNGNKQLSGCNRRTLQKNKAALCKVIDRYVSLSDKKRLIVRRGGCLLPLLSAVLQTIASLILRNKLEKTCYVRCTLFQLIVCIGKEALSSRSQPIVCVGGQTPLSQET